MALHAAVLVPIGSVLCEELAFRGVLTAAASRLIGAPAGIALAATVFALWHISHAVDEDGAVAGATVLAVTGAGGIAFGVLRHLSGSLLAPIGLHLGTNAIGLVAVAGGLARLAVGLGRHPAG